MSNNIEHLRCPRSSQAFGSFPCARYPATGQLDEPSIAAASILAKVARDAFMIRVDRRYPAYGFRQHKGYATGRRLPATVAITLAGIRGKVETVRRRLALLILLGASGPPRVATAVVQSSASFRGRGGKWWAAGLAAAAAFYVASVPGNQLAFDVDESSIAYNAFTVSRTGSDEFGDSWPVYFLAFGEYKNPTFIYLLAALFTLGGPSVLLARLLSAALGFLAAVLLGVLTKRTCGRWAGVLVTLTALVTPWLFETSRLVLEVAAYPLALVLFLLALHRTFTRWSSLDSIWLAVTLGLVTYTYSIGRLLGPLLAVGLILFLSRRRWRWIVQTLVIYAGTLVPLFAFAWHNPGALTSRFSLLTYMTPQTSPREIVSDFVEHYVRNLSWRRLLVEGDANLTVHVPGMGGLLAATAVLALAGLAVILGRHWRDPWWRFVLYALAASLVPASLTNCEICTLRLIALPVLLLVLTGPAWAWLLGGGRGRTLRRTAACLLTGLTLLQGALFQWQFYQIGPKRPSDLDYLKVFEAATAVPQRPMYLLVGRGRLRYIHAYWYGTVRGVDTSEFVRLAVGEHPPTGALVIGEAEDGGCGRCQIIMREGPYVAYRAW